MNLKQLAYQYGRLKNSNIHVICPVVTLVSLAYLNKWGTAFVKSGSMEDFIPSSVFALFSLGYGALSVSGIRSKRKLNKLKKDKGRPESNSIVLDDKQGLEMLLEKTAKSKRREWGTVLKAYEDKSSAVIYKILAPDSAKDKKLIRSISKKVLWVNHKLMGEEGYTGMHHYHPNKIIRSCGAEHFAINIVDRAAGDYIGNSNVNLLTFNLPEGPEIIGYDALHTYIPSDKSKQELIRATPKQIMEYLS
jgi:hypothetical protein